MSIIDRLLNRDRNTPPTSNDKFYIITGSHNKPVVTSQLVSFFEERTNSEGFLYTGYPLIGTVDGAFAIDAMLISKRHGLIAFDVIEAESIDGYEEKQDDLYTKLQAYLLQYNNIVQKRQLVVDLTIITIAPRSTHNDPHSEYPIVNNFKDLDNFIEKKKWKQNAYYEHLHSIVQNITSIRSNKHKRKITSDNSRGAILKRLEDSIANLDHTQADAVINTFDGVQRIRGLAGSGKTIVLALKVAYLHAMNPEWDIAVTFNTRSLKKQFKDLISRFVMDRTKEEPDWDKISIIHAWGAPGDVSKKGIYHDFCLEHGQEYCDFQKAKELYGYDDAFSGVCKAALDNCSHNINPKYDAMLIDEAQDFISNDNAAYFLQLCYGLLREPKRLIYAYDELQSLSMKHMPSPEVLFGSKDNGQPHVPNDQFDDIILHKCYRNSRPVLSTAHALGFGIYHPKGLIQMFKNKDIWSDIGYEISGEMETGNPISLARTLETSPKFLEELSPKDDLLEFKEFSSDEEQIKFLVEDIVHNLKHEDLLPSDIIVIHSNPLSTMKAVSKARVLLFEAGINSNIAGVSTSPDIFQEPNSVTFTGIYRAKGNEAGMVYVINGQECYQGFSLARKRNILFTAITRSKAWVKVLGYGDSMKLLCEEYQKVVDNDYKLNFIYPSSDEMQQMNLINRDRDPHSEKKIIKLSQNLEEIVSQLESGNLDTSDLDSATLQKLRHILKPNDER